MLTRTHEDARELARLIEEEDWGGEVHVYQDQAEIDRALGEGRQGHSLLSVGGTDQKVNGRSRPVHGPSNL